jgi:capsule polysaccharide export protein KpsE/RkpR
MEPTDVTVEILKSIRDEVRKTNERLESVEMEVRGVKNEVGALKQAQVATEMHLVTELVAVRGALTDVMTLLRDNLSSTLKDHERRIAVLEARAEP